jgi:hypothetical protein
MVRGATAVAARAEAETKVMIVMAHQNPRDEHLAYTKMVNACARPTFAEAARYYYERGGNPIDGLSIGFAREASRVWGNMVHGVEVVAHLSETEAPPHGRVDVIGYAWDLETNVRSVKPVTFKALIYRKKGGWIKPDERDFRELVARNGAIAERNAILDMLPPDLKEDLLQRLRKTGAERAARDLERDRAGVMSAMVKAFGEFGVTEAMLLSYVSLKKWDKLAPEQLARLRAVYTGLHDNAYTAASVFPELGGTAAARGDQSAAAKEAEDELTKAATRMHEGEWVEEGSESDGPGEGEAVEEKPKRAAPLKRRGKAAKPEPEEEEAGPEIHVHEGAWVGDLPKVSDLPYILDNVDETVVVDLYERDERKGALEHYYRKLEALGYEME